MLAITALWWEKVVLETEHVGSRGVASSSGLAWAAIAMHIWILCILLLPQLVISGPLDHPLAGKWYSREA